MKMPVLTSVVIFVIILLWAIRRSARENKNELDEFLRRENEANSTRRQPINDLPYIKIPEEFFFPDENVPSEIQETIKNLNFLKDQRILNLTGLSNTELKLKYGAANLPELSACDERYTLLIRSLHKYAEWLSSNDQNEKAISVLEFTISTGSDMLISYKLLTTLYTENGKEDKIPSLKEKAAELNSLTAPSILRFLDKY